MCKFTDALPWTKVTGVFGKTEEPKKTGLSKTTSIIIGCAIGFLALVGLGFLLYKLFNRNRYENDLYDDLDYYYDDDVDLEDGEAVEVEAAEATPAE